MSSTHPAPTLPPPDPALPPPEKAPLIAAAMSGGVDSAVAAGLLKAQGYRVVGITLQLNPKTAHRHPKACCAGADIYDAKMAAAKLDIPHYVLDYQTIFRREIIEAFAKDYAAGRTPSPCTRCNQKIKFGHLLSFAQEIGAGMLATGHYVRREQHENRIMLCRGCDSVRDQSYFLLTLTRNQLAKTCFPLGALSKEGVRHWASTFGLSLADKPASQDLCFTAGKPYWQMVEKHTATPKAGTLHHADGRILGSHAGLHRYTLGQRRGLGIAGLKEPLFVVDINAETNSVTLGPQSALETSNIMLNELNWLPETPLPTKGIEILARTRSTAPLQPAWLKPAPNGEAELNFHKPTPRPAAGQACAFYAISDNGNEVLGGGFVCDTPSMRQPRPNPANPLHEQKA